MGPNVPHLQGLSKSADTNLHPFVLTLPTPHLMKLSSLMYRLNLHRCYLNSTFKFDLKHLFKQWTVGDIQRGVLRLVGLLLFLFEDEALIHLLPNIISQRAAMIAA